MGGKMDIFLASLSWAFTFYVYVRGVAEVSSEKQDPILTGRCCCSLKVWQLGSSSPNFTLEGHEKGVNCIDYYSGGDKPYLISGADDRLVKIWDYQVQFYYNYLPYVRCASYCFLQDS